MYCRIDPGNEAPGFLVRTHLAASLLHSGEYAEAEKIVLGLQNSYGAELELLVLLEQIYLAWGRDAQAIKLQERPESMRRKILADS